MKALVTGSSGFIGRHFLRRLWADGWDVDHCDVQAGQDAIDLFRLSRTRYDLVVHAAANVGGRAKIDGDPLWIAHNLAIDEACFRHAVRTRSRVLYFSSSASYQTMLQTGWTHQPLHEDVWVTTWAAAVPLAPSSFIAKLCSRLRVVTPHTAFLR